MELPLILILGIVAPFAIAVLNKVKWSSKAKQLVALGVSVVLAVVWFALTGGIAEFGMASLIAAVPGIYTLSQIVYEFVFKNIISKLEAASDRDAIVVLPDVDPNRVVVTSNETIKVSEVTPESANVVADAPVVVETAPKPRG